MYQLSQSSRPNQLLVVEVLNQQPHEERQCTDIVCLFIFLIFTLAFIGLLLYAVISGSPSTVFSAYNSNKQSCLQTNYPYGFLPNNKTLINAVCVNKCPNANQTIQCLSPSINCTSGTIKSTYNTFQLFFFCIPDPSLSNGTSITAFFSYSLFGQWMYDVSNGYIVLILAGVAALIVSIVYLCIMRCCTGCLIWISIIGFLAIIVALGALLLMQGLGVQLSSYLPSQLTSVSKNQLIIAGSVFLGVALLFGILLICMCGRLKIGIKTVKIASIYLSQHCLILFLPILTTILFLGFLALILLGGIYLYSTGSTFLNPGQVFPLISIESYTFALIIIYGLSGLWILFFIHGCNEFILTSSSCIWYYSNSNKGLSLNSPIWTSIFRLFRYHIGTVAFSSLLFAVFFILRVLFSLLDVRNEKSENCFISCCLKFVDCCFCICNLFLRFLSEGIYVQLALRGKNYCASTLEAFNVIQGNLLKLELTSGVAFIVTLVGVFLITSGICFAAYFSQIEIPGLAFALTDPVPLTVFSGILSFVITVIYLSLLGITSSAIIQCYIMDESSNKAKGQKAKYCPQTIRVIFDESILT